MECIAEPSFENGSEINTNKKKTAVRGSPKIHSVIVLKTNIGRFYFLSYFMSIHYPNISVIIII